MGVLVRIKTDISAFGQAIADLINPDIIPKLDHLAPTLTTKARPAI